MRLGDKAQPVPYANPGPITVEQERDASGKFTGLTVIKWGTGTWQTRLHPQDVMIALCERFREFAAEGERCPEWKRAPSGDDPC